MNNATMRTAGWVLAIATILAAGVSCQHKAKTVLPVSRYPQLPLRPVPEYLKGTILEQVDLANTEPFFVNGYGLVGRLNGTGDSTAPQAVRQYMLKEATRHGFGSPLIPEFRGQDPQEILNDPHYAIVRVDASIPPGARRDQRVDVQVSALPESSTSSLAGGVLFLTDLRVRGTEDLQGTVGVQARAQGDVFINPAYAVGLGGDDSAAEARSSKRRGVILDGGLVKEDRPLYLRIRQAQLRMSRAVELRINERFQGISDKPTKRDFKSFLAAEAQDEGLVYLYVPNRYARNWEHFAGVATHLFLNNSPAFAAEKARELAEHAVVPDAPLLDISYCWEGLGEKALPFVLPLMSHENADVAFAAARAAAFLGDASAQNALVRIARTPNNPFQVSAVQVLGELPTSPEINMKLRELLSSDQTMVRVEAYRILAAARDPLLYTKVIDEEFVLDIVPASGSPLIYASRTGVPRIAVFGARPSVELPVTFVAMDSRFSLSSLPGEKAVTLFYRGGDVPKPVKVLSNPDIAEIIARLGGEGPDREPRLNFGYADVVGIVQALADQKKLVAKDQSPVAFVLQESPALVDDIYNAPIIPDNARPQQSDEQKAEVGMGK